MAIIPQEIFDKLSEEQKHEIREHYKFCRLYDPRTSLENIFGLENLWPSQYPKDNNDGRLTLKYLESNSEYNKINYHGDIAFINLIHTEAGKDAYLRCVYSELYKERNFTIIVDPPLVCENVTLLEKEGVTTIKELEEIIKDVKANFTTLYVKALENKIK